MTLNVLEERKKILTKFFHNPQNIKQNNSLVYINDYIDKNIEYNSSEITAHALCELVDDNIITETQVYIGKSSKTYDIYFTAV